MKPESVAREQSKWQLELPLEKDALAACSGMGVFDR